VREVFLFPGQGSEHPGMGGGAVERPGPVRRLVMRASEALGLDLARTIARGGPSLARTEVAQPALVAVSLGLALEAVGNGVRPFAAAGHSVGELAAFALAGCLEPEEAVDCTVERARLMGLAARRSPGTMAAVRVASEVELEQALALGRSVGWLEVAAHNGPGDWVLSGERAAVGAVASRFSIAPLPVSGPWHSQAMAEAAVVWRECLQRRSWHPPRILLVANATGRPVTAEDDPIELLSGQLTGTVLWAESLATLAAVATRWHVFGPGRVLRGLCRASLGTAAAIEVHGESPELRP